MSESDSGITYPRYTPFYERRRGYSYYADSAGPHIGIRLFGAESIAADRWKELYGNSIAGSGVQVASFGSHDELVAFLVGHWKSLLDERKLSVVFESAGGELDALPIAKLLREDNPERFYEQTAYKSRYNWSRPGRDQEKFLPLRSGKGGFVTTPGFLLSNGGTILLPEAVRIGVAHSHGDVYTVDDISKTTDWIAPMTRYESWVGAFFLRRRPTVLDVIYESIGAGSWEFQLQLAEGEIGQWFERPLARDGSWHPEKSRATE